MWYQLNVGPCGRDEVDALSELLEEHEALSVTLLDQNDDPVLEPAPGTTPLWPEVIVQALFADAQMAQVAKALVAQRYPAIAVDLSILADQDWERAWMSDFKPICFGQRLWVCPSWHTPPDPAAANLMLDPGLAFGTGTHPTTALCLSWLDQADVQDKCLIDYGCGSGILALAAIKLGAAHVFAVDIDDQALQATLANAATNQIGSSQLTVGHPDAIQQPVDLILANILLLPLLSLQSRLASLVKPSGRLVVSGLLEEQIPELTAAYQSQFIIEKTEARAGWGLIELRRTS